MNKADANKQYLFLLILFFTTAGPGPALLFLNKYTVSVLPLVNLICFYFVLKKELINIDFNAIIINRYTYILAWKSIQWGVYAHAACALLFKPNDSLSLDLLTHYPIMAVNIVLIGPILEEVIYRKILFGYFYKKTNYWIAASLSSFIFATAHLTLERFIAYFIVGMAFCYIYKKSSTIAPSIFAHTVLNLFSVLMITLK
jgi:membrane protease YdiL (CAAX protease family)